MIIVINAYSARLGGGKTYLRNLLKHLPDDPTLDIRIFCPDDVQLPPDPRITRAHSGWATANPVIRTLWEMFGLPRYLASSGCDVLFCPGGVVATRAPKGVKVVTMFRNMTPFDPRAMEQISFGLPLLRLKILRHVFLKSLSEADLSIFISNYARECIERLTKIPNPVTIPHGVGEDFRAKPENVPDQEIEHHQPYLVYVSKFDRYKHQRYVLQEFFAFNALHNNTYSMVFIGEFDKFEYESFSEALAQHEDSGKIIVKGHVPYDKLALWYGNAEAIIFASSCENCPNILLESLSSGKPVICSDIAPMPEFGGDDILYFTPEQDGSLSDMLKTAFANPDMLAAAARAGEEQSRKFTWTQTAERTWRAITDLVAGHRTSIGT